MEQKPGTKIRIIYAPQGDKIEKAEQRDIYNNINQQIKERRENGEKVYVYAKIGESIVNGDAEVNRGGKELLRMVKENNLGIINALETRRGTWTRIEGEKKAVLDYIMIM